MIFLINFLIVFFFKFSLAPSQAQIQVSHPEDHQGGDCGQGKTPLIKTFIYLSLASPNTLGEAFGFAIIII